MNFPLFSFLPCIPVPLHFHPLPSPTLLFSTSSSPSISLLIDEDALPKADQVSQMAPCQTKTYSIPNHLKREYYQQARIISEVDYYRKHILKTGRDGNEC